MSLLKFFIVALWISCLSATAFAVEEVILMTDPVQLCVFDKKTGKKVRGDFKSQEEEQTYLSKVRAGLYVSRPCNTAETPEAVAKQQMGGGRSPAVAPAKPSFDPLAVPPPKAKPAGRAPAAEMGAESKPTFDPTKVRTPKFKSDVIAPEPAFVAQRPIGNNEEYIRSGQIPKFLRVNMNGYNIRKTPEFETARSDNIDFKSLEGSLFAVTQVRPMDSGAAVGIHVQGEERWVFVPYSRQKDFQFCESEACYSEMDLVLKMLQSQGTNLSLEDIRQCIMPQPEPRTPKPVEKERVRPVADVKKLDERVPTSQRPLQIKTWWETKPKLLNSSTGAKWTEMLRASLRTYGKDLLKTTRIADASAICPRFASLQPHEREEMWLHLMVGKSHPESHFKTNKTFDERRLVNRRSGPIDRKNYSMGLFALSYVNADSPQYRPACSGLDWRRDKYKDVSDRSLTIYDPKVQMDCAVGILNHLVKRDGRVTNFDGGPTRGGSAYWSTFRRRNPASRDVRNAMKRFTPCWQASK